MAMVWPVPSSDEIVDAVGGPDLGRGVGDRPRGRRQARALAIALPLRVSGIDDDGDRVAGTADLGIAALDKLGCRCVDRAADPLHGVAAEGQGFRVADGPGRSESRRMSRLWAVSERAVAAQGDAAVSAVLFLVL